MTVIFLQVLSCVYALCCHFESLYGKVTHLTEKVELALVVVTKWHRPFSRSPIIAGVSIFLLNLLPLDVFAFMMAGDLARFLL